MANFKYLATVILFSCSCRSYNISNSCPDISIYTPEEQREIDRIISATRNITLNKFLIDYYNLREKIRECKK